MNRNPRDYWHNEDRLAVPYCQTVLIVQIIAADCDSFVACLFDTDFRIWGHEQQKNSKPIIVDRGVIQVVTIMPKHCHVIRAPVVLHSYIKDRHCTGGLTYDYNRPVPYGDNFCSFRCLARFQEAKLKGLVAKTRHSFMPYVLRYKLTQSDCEFQYRKFPIQKIYTASKLPFVNWPIFGSLHRLLSSYVTENRNRAQVLRVLQWNTHRYVSWRLGINKLKQCTSTSTGITSRISTTFLCISAPINAASVVNCLRNQNKTLNTWLPVLGDRNSVIAGLFIDRVPMYQRYWTPW